MRSELFALAHHPARDRDLKVKREKPIYRRYLEADELLDVLDAALAIDQRSSAETLELAETVRHLREVERLPWKQIAARIGRAESTAIWLSRQRAGGRRGRRAAIATLGLSGLRSQEVAGLRLRHLDFTHGRIVIEDGKTHGSVREVHMSPFLREELLLYVAELKLTGPDDLLFPTKRGTPRSRQNLNRRVLAPAVARAAQARAARGDSVLPPAITPHTLRRTFVTLSAQAGRSASWVQAQIGHADMTTMQRYYLQASRSEIQPRIKRLIEYLLGEADAADGARDDGPRGEDRVRGTASSPQRGHARPRCPEIHANSGTEVHAFCARNRLPPRGRRAVQEPALCRHFREWRDPDSNRGHHDFQSCALPTELSRRAPKG